MLGAGLTLAGALGRGADIAAAMEAPDSTTRIGLQERLDSARRVRVLARKARSNGSGTTIMVFGAGGCGFLGLAIGSNVTRWKTVLPVNP